MRLLIVQSGYLIACVVFGVAAVWMFGILQLAFGTRPNALALIAGVLFGAFLWTLPGKSKMRAVSELWFTTLYSFYYFGIVPLGISVAFVVGHFYPWPWIGAFGPVLLGSIMVLFSGFYLWDLGRRWDEEKTPK